MDRNIFALHIINIIFNKTKHKKKFTFNYNLNARALKNYFYFNNVRTEIKLIKNE